MVTQGSLSETGSDDTAGRIVVDESDYSLEEDKLPFEIKEVVRIRANEKFSKFYECFDEIGEGKFGKVYRCREKATGLELAAKRIKIKRDADRVQVEKEVSIMTQMRHPRIAQIYDAFSTPDNDIILVMEVVRGGELFDRVVDENYILTETAVVMIVCQLCEAISYIHSKKIVHLDIKPENIMCVSQMGNRIKLIDFGLAQHYDGSSNLLFMAGTPEFVAPEVIKFEPIDFHTDMWSIGVITYILLSGISPFLGESLGETYCSVEKGDWEFDEEAFEGISDSAKDFISKLLVYDQKKRMLPEECLLHEWIVGSRHRASNDLLLNQPNVGKPLSKEDGNVPSTSNSVTSINGHLNGTSTTPPEATKEVSEKPQTTVSKKVKASESNCETPEKKPKVAPEAKESPKVSIVEPVKEVAEKKEKRDETRRDDDRQTNQNRSRTQVKTSSEINRKANSVAKILSMFDAKDEVPITPRMLERRASRAGRTTRDVERPLKKMSSVLLDDLPPAALGDDNGAISKPNSSDENNKQLDELKKILQHADDQMEDGVSTSDSVPVPTASRARKLGTIQSPTTHDVACRHTTETTLTLCGNEAPPTKGQGERKCTSGHATSSGDAGSDINGNSEKRLRKVDDSSKSSAVQEEKTHCTSMVIPTKIDTNKTMTVKTKIGAKKEKKTTVPLNGQLMEQSSSQHVSTDNFPLPIAQERIRKNSTGIAQFRSMALRDELRKTSTEECPVGLAKDSVGMIEKTRSGKPSLSRQKNLDDTVPSETRTTLPSGHETSIRAKRVNSSERDSNNYEINHSLSPGNREKSDNVSNKSANGKKMVQGTIDGSSAKVSCEKPPSGLTDKRPRLPKKSNDARLGEPSASSACKVSNDSNLSSTSSLKTGKDSLSSRSSSNVSEPLDEHKLTPSAFSRTSSEANSENSDCQANEVKKKVGKKKKANTAADETPEPSIASSDKPPGGKTSVSGSTKSTSGLSKTATARDESPKHSDAPQLTTTDVGGRSDASSSSASSVMDSKRKSSKKGKSHESSSEEEIKKPKLTVTKPNGRDWNEKRIEPKLSWRSELLKSFDAKNGKARLNGLDNGQLHDENTPSSALTVPTEGRGKDGYSSDGECGRRASLKPITANMRDSNKHRSLVNLPPEADASASTKPTKRKVKFSAETLEQKPTPIRICNPVGYALSRVRSESNIAEKAKISLESSKVRRMTMDDSGADQLKTVTNDQETSAQRCKPKRPDIGNLGFLKTRMESRIADEKKGDSRKSKNDFKIPICASSNARRALDMWKNMEQTQK